jgi:hypothetical protein
VDENILDETITRHGTCSSNVNHVNMEEEKSGKNILESSATEL